MISYVQGNLLQDTADMLVNPVNCVGIMGAGLAKQFKDWFPEMFTEYRVACDADEVKLGAMHVFSTGTFLASPFYIVNFPTKNHWKNPSELAAVETGVVDLARVVKELKVRSVAVPALGCGLGGLSWSEVQPILERGLRNVSAEVRIYVPVEQVPL